MGYEGVKLLSFFTESQLFSPKTTLEKLWRQKTVVQVELDNQMREQTWKNSKEVDNLEKVPM